MAQKNETSLARQALGPAATQLANMAQINKEAGGQFDGRKLSEAQFQKLLAIIGSNEENYQPLSGKTFIPINSKANWIIDTGASMHMTGHGSLLNDPVEIKGSSPVFIPNGGSSRATRIGKVDLGSNFILNNVLFVPDFKCNLISVAQLTHDLGCQVMFISDLCVIQDRTSRMTIGLGELQGGVYYLRHVASSLACMAVIDSELWHRRLGHPSRQVDFSGTGLTLGARLSKECDVCHRAKQTRSNFPKSMNKAEFSFQLVHCDLWGPYRESSITGARYFLTIVDDYSRGTWIYLLRMKSDVQRYLVGFCNMVKNQFDKSVKII